MAKKIYFHPIFFLCTMIALMTGFFKPYLFLFYLFFCHECGHIITACYYRWNIKKIIVLPFGGLTIFEEQLNRPIKEEFVITIMGPIFQIIAYHIITLVFYKPYFLILHLSFLCFNLIPIYPLDGSKLLLLFLEKLFPIYQSYQSLLLISCFFAILLFLYMPQNLILLCMLLFLLKKVWEEYRKLPFTFDKFLLERYLKHLHFSKYIKIRKLNLKKMKRDRSHLFLLENKWLSEATILKKWFDK